MRKRVAMIARLQKLEQRQLEMPMGRRVIFSLAGKSDDDIVGMTNDRDLHVGRLAGEEMAAFVKRAGGVIASHCMFCVYGPPGAAEERDCDDRGVQASIRKPLRV